MIIDNELIKILVCPECKRRVHRIAEKGLICNKCNICYAVKDGVPVMISKKEASQKNEGH